MQVEVMIPLWQITVLLIGFAGSFAVIAYMTRSNTKKVESLTIKCEDMMEEEKARKTFVSLDLYNSEINHLNKTLDEVKKSVSQILTILTTKPN